ncbi:zinc finger protein 623-like [Hypanus sabinus]|uniref:zinc finger protein 623-like n=1 Tax=Hypanus sabinus TaxID=79690 RepID=UPI0028C436BE|nr:zinc finger protein 623-like [Hypanus sabinus]
MPPNNAHPPPPGRPPSTPAGYWFSLEQKHCPSQQGPDTSALMIHEPQSPPHLPLRTPFSLTNNCRLDNHRHWYPESPVSSMLSRVKNRKEFVSRKFKHGTPVWLFLSRNLRSGARDPIDHPSCSNCGEGFTQSSFLLRLWGGIHLVITIEGTSAHSHWARPFTCSVCEKGSSQSSHLWTHQFTLGRGW